MNTINSAPIFFLSAGEASGDHYGAEILLELRNRISDLTAFGLGGKDMEAAGLQRIVCAEDVAIMGITEVIRHMPSIYAEYRKLANAIKTKKPDLAILIDFPDVNLRLAKILKKLEIPVVYFVSPQLWAWKKKRLHLVQQLIDKMLVIFPFEEPFYRARNVNAEFVGHPLAALPLPTISREEFASKYGLDATKSWISLLPGSRTKEIRLNFPEMLRAAEILLQRHPYEFLLPRANTISETFLHSILRATKTRVIPVDDARSAMFHSRASIVSSGTATIQALTIGNPFVIVYRVSQLTYKAARRLVRYPAEINASRDVKGNLPIGMVNLVAGRRIIPEFLQEQFTAEAISASLCLLLEETPSRATMMIDLKQVRQQLLPPNDIPPIMKVCDAIELLLRDKISSRKHLK